MRGSLWSRNREVLIGLGGWVEGNFLTARFVSLSRNFTTCENAKAIPPPAASLRAHDLAFDDALAITPRACGRRLSSLFPTRRRWAHSEVRSESCRGSLGLSDFLALSRLFSACSTGGGAVCAFVLWSCASPRPDCISVAPNSYSVSRWCHSGVSSFVGMLIAGRCPFLCEVVTLLVPLVRL